MTDWFTSFVLAGEMLSQLDHVREPAPPPAEDETPPPALERLRLMRPDLFS